MTPMMNDTPTDPPEPNAPRDRMSDAVHETHRLPSFDPASAGPAPRSVEPARGYTLGYLSSMFAFADLIARAALQVKADRAREGLA